MIVGNQPLNLARGDSDIAVRATAAPPENLFGRKLGSVAWAAYGQQGVEAGIADANELFAQRWVSYGSSLAGLGAAAFIERHVAGERVIYRSDSVLGVSAAIAAGIGVGLVPCMHGDLHPRLVRLGVLAAMFFDELWLLTHPDIRRSGRVYAFMTYCAEAMTKQRDFIEGRGAALARQCNPAEMVARKRTPDD